MSLLAVRDTYRPLMYPAALDYWRRQQQIHWLPDEVDMSQDVKDWNQKLTAAERNLLTQLFRFFVQGDVDVASGYFDKYLPVLGGQPEVKMMMGAFANMEGVHVVAYARLLDTVGMPEVEYQAFKAYAEMAAKHDYVGRFDPTTADRADTEGFVRELVRTLAVYSAFTEGLQLFSSFAILMNFARFGKMRGMNKIVEWSIRDETLHTEAMCWLTRTLVAEHPTVWTDPFKKELYDIARRMVELEDAFIDLCFAQGGIEGLGPMEVKSYIRYIADRRLKQLGLKANYGIEQNPLDWLDWMLGDGHTNFFENRETEYSKASLTGSWEEAW